MRRKIIAGSLIVATTLLLVRTTTGQVQPVPGPGTGIVTVQGEVDVRRMPLVDVGQRGDWKVSLANVADARIVNTPVVSLSRPPFARSGGRYAITWPSGEQDTVTVTQAGDGAWVRTTINGRERWLNLAQARAIEELQ